jgi:hypothetical protein
VVADSTVADLVVADLVGRGELLDLENFVKSSLAEEGAFFHYGTTTYGTGTRIGVSFNQLYRNR